MSTRANRRRLVFAASLTAAALSSTVIVCSGAVFTSTTDVTGNVFSSGRVVLLTNPVPQVFNLDNMAPGDKVTEAIQVKNDGSLSLRYAMESTATGPLASALTLAVKTGVTNCSNTGFGSDGTVLYGPGSLGTTSSMKVFGDKQAGADPGDRVLDAGDSDMLCLQITLPGSSTGNEFQTESAQAVFNFAAEQVA